MIPMKNKLLFGISFFLIMSAQASDYLVSNKSELTNAIKQAVPGDQIILRKGIWENTEIIFEGNGTAQKNITLKAEVAGQTILSGNSSIKIGGSYLVVDGLYFNNGYHLESVIEFRKNDQLLANHCRVTNCAIMNYAPPTRFENENNWVIFWGQYNRMDHCTIGDKLNAGTTVIVNLNDERSQNNYHSIDSNYFYTRTNLGSNGGELLRIGISRYSLTPSQTTIKNNYFEKCSGEVEIISVKSCYNYVLENTFYECEGSVVLRHGNHNVVSGNLFLGNNKPNTGGIRVINPNQTVTNNLVINCVGDRFRSALSVMNAVPNSQLNRYYQVKDSKITNNSFINCANIIFGVGKDFERTLPPANVLFENNFILGKNLYQDENKDGGIIFKANATNMVTTAPGFKNTGVQKLSWHNLILTLPTDKSMGADLNKVAFVEKEKVGAYWKFPTAVAVIKGKLIQVNANAGIELSDVIAKSNSNDTILLLDPLYELKKPIFISKPLVIMAKTKAEWVNAVEKSIPSFITIENGGSLIIKGIHFNSAYKSYGDAQSAIVTAKTKMLQHYVLQVENCEFYNFNESSYACIKASKGSLADSIVVNNCIFRNMSGNAIDLSSERDDKGMYNAEKVIVKNTVFYNMLASAINVYRGGNDESTTGPAVTIDHCLFNDVDNREQGCVIKLLGVQYARILNSSFYLSGQGGTAIMFQELRWDNIKVDDCNFYKSGRIQSFRTNLIGKNITKIAPTPNKLFFNNYIQ
jgi:poly(beta-D-mannuronate) lyase